MIGTIIRRLRALTRPPEPIDRTLAEASTTLHFILLGGTAVGVGCLVIMPLLRANPWPTVGTYATMIAAHCIALWRLRRGNVRGVAIAISLFMFAFITVNAYRAGGLGGVGIFVYPTVVIFAGLTWSAWAAVGFAVASSIAALAMVLIHETNPHASASPVTPMGAWVLLTGVVAIISLMLGMALRSMRLAAQRERSLQDQLREAQKLEALGRLAGGVAHDFNNLLTVILLHTSLMKLESDRPQESVGPIEQAALRAADMTQQLLALGRRQSVLAKVVEVNQALRDTVTLVRALLPTNIELRIQYGDSVGHTKVDPAGLERIVINLVINARDAMPDGGEIKVSTDACLIDTEHARRAQVPPGRYIRLVVRDNGPGISESIKGRLFEPFATTKAGKGTGLGLASVRGIVLQSGGGISIESAIGEGATFEILLPPSEGPTDTLVETKTVRSEAPVRVLLLDEDPTVRAVTRAMLETAGYVVGDTVSDARELDAALHDANVLLTDELDSTGHSLDDLRARHPSLRVAVMHKPFTREQLLATVNAALSHS